MKIKNSKDRSVFCRAVSTMAMATALFLGSITTVSAEEAYPTKPVKLIVPYGAGGATDLAARALASVIPEYLNQAVIVVNVKGAGGSIGFNKVRVSKPDGYTMMMTAIGANVLRPAMYQKLPYSYDELDYISRTQINPNVLIVKPGTFTDFQSFSKYLMANPGKLKYGTAGAGNVSHLGPGILLEQLGLPNSAAKAIHYDSDASALLALLQGEVDFVQGNLAPYAGAIKGATVTALAVTTPERLSSFKDTPTFTELGYPGVSIVGWRGVAGPKGLPDEVIRAWEKAIEQTTSSASWNQLINKLGDEEGYLNATEYTSFVDNDFARYRKLATELDLLRK